MPRQILPHVYKNFGDLIMRAKQQGIPQRKVHGRRGRLYCVIENNMLKAIDKGFNLMRIGYHPNKE